MRNVPPLPANYWQRAGRRHRMAVNLTYCRPISHDRAYFAEPLKLLAGRFAPQPRTYGGRRMQRESVSEKKYETNRKKGNWGRTGTAFFFDTGEGPFLVTADHVFQGYLDAKQP